ncbi:hypothetical protein ACJJI3_11135 [Microbulbifer sp. ZKSA004]|uniref:hypothetical protein n=1 Tax=Microbulbifer sp. ZKSA004 TaxID=3243389 RepID=UPI00403A5C7F
MSKVWRETADPQKHIDYISTRNEGGVTVKASRDNLIDNWVYFATACNFTFQFSSIDQVQECKDYFLKSIHPSTQEAGHDLEHYWHPWYSKLPKGINKGVKRQKVIKVLDSILDKWSYP